MSLDIAALRDDMDILALETWDKLEAATRANIPFREDSLTDHNLLMLRTRHPNFLLHRYDQNREHAVGADWEWWVGSDEVGWLCLRIQAKRFYDSSYPELSADGDAGDRYQYDTLIRSCDLGQGEHPLHVFYNGWESGRFAPNTRWAVPATWRACPNRKLYNHCKHAEPRHYGCAAASSFAVRATHKGVAKPSLRIVHHLSNAIPWSYVLGYPVRGRREDAWDNDVDLDTWMTRAQATLQLMGRTDAPAEAWLQLRHDDVDCDTNAKQEHLPEYAEAIRVGAAAEFRAEVETDRPAAPITVVLDRGVRAQ